MASNDQQAQAQLEINAQAYLGRNQGPEFFTSVTHTSGAVNTVLIPKNLSLNRPLEAILVRWTGRVVVGVANYTTVAAEAPSTIINQIKINGTFKGTALTPIQLSGATAYAWARMFGLRGSSTYITNGGVTTRVADPTVPYSMAGATFGNTGTYDIDVWYMIPTWPIVPQSNRARASVPYYWLPKDWADSLQITLGLGDKTSFGTPAGGTTVTFSAFGGGTGDPSVQVFTRYAILGTLRDGFRSACVIRNEQTITSGVTGVASNLRLTPLQKQKTTNILLKSGVNLTGVSSGVQVFSTLNDTTFDRTLIVVDNKFIRNNQTNLAAKESVGFQYNTIEPQGYLPFTFIDSGTPRTAFRADLPTVVGAGSSFELDTDIIAANANTQANVVQEMIFADVDDPYWAGTR
jgi:hypothetical protein